MLLQGLKVQCGQGRMENKMETIIKCLDLG